MTMDHVFSIGSILKEMVRLAAYDLADEGRLTLDDSVGRWIEAWPEDKAAITLRQLVEHTSGLPDIVDPGGAPSEFTPEYDFERVSRAEMIERARKSRLLFEPGADEAYSNLGYSLLAATLENATGQDIETILRERIFEPAGMTHTGYVQTDWSTSSFAEGCREDGSRWGVEIKDGRWLADGPGWNLRGNGGLYSTAGDMAAFMGGLADDRFLSAAAAEAWRNDRLVFVQSMDARVMGPAGGNGINNAIIMWVEETDTSEDMRFVFMTNRARFQAEDHSRLLTRPAYRAVPER
jgi:CubicO group peptidase (beta-lactamase class C family)